MHLVDHQQAHTDHLHQPDRPRCQRGQVDAPAAWQRGIQSLQDLGEQPFRVRYRRHVDGQHRGAPHPRRRIEAGRMIAQEFLRDHRLAHAAIAPDQHVRHAGPRRTVQQVGELAQRQDRARGVNPAVGTDTGNAFGIGQVQQLSRCRRQVRGRPRLLHLTVHRSIPRHRRPAGLAGRTLRPRLLHHRPTHHCPGHAPPRRREQTRSLAGPGARLQWRPWRPRPARAGG